MVNYIIREYFSYIDKLYTSSSAKKLQDHQHMKNMLFKQSRIYNVFWTGQKTWAQLPRPNNKPSPNTAFGEITRNTPLPREGGCSEQRRIVQTSHNVRQRLCTHVSVIISPAVTLHTIS